jgi:hypothetical protein
VPSGKGSSPSKTTTPLWTRPRISIPPFSPALPTESRPAFGPLSLKLFVFRVDQGLHRFSIRPKRRLTDCARSPSRVRDATIVPTLGSQQILGHSLFMGASRESSEMDPPQSKRKTAIWELAGRGSKTYRGEAATKHEIRNLKSEKMRAQRGDGAGVDSTEKVAFCLLIGRRPSRTRGHLCHIRDHVSPYCYIRGVTPHSLIRRW